ncbi:DNA gyrase inhibitor YacG [Devosia sp. 2618]|uniref:DNA gyrase inhibitor YacG n=1 Tax=Devosia sp. 2618 TaxID=3156454 RepID=UPI00339407A2
MLTEKKCPICGKPSVEAFRPFCSKRCADVDLNRWLTGSYVIPARDDEPLPDLGNGVPDYNEDDNI